MNGVLLAVRVVLALVFVVAALAKAADRPGSREALRAFGVPEALTGPFSIALPLLELASAILLIPSATARAGAGIALFLLLGFCAGIARSMIRGDAPDCHCFGQLHSAPAGPKTLARNVVLAGAAATVLLGGGGTSATRWVLHTSGPSLVAIFGGVAIGAALVGGAGLMLSLLRRHGQLLLRIDALESALAARGIAVPSATPEPAPTGLPVGSPAPDAELANLDGDTVRLREHVGATRPTLLLFTDPGCGPCSALLPQVADWQRDHAESIRMVVVSRGERAANIAHAREHGLVDVLLQTDREVMDLYRIAGTPSAILLDENGSIASPVHGGAESVTGLLAAQLNQAPLTVHTYDPQVGRPAPDARLRTLDGQERPLSSMLSGPVVLLFWNPACGFCERMLPELREVEPANADDPPKLVLISTGEPETNRAMGLRSPILLDGSFAAGRAFGAQGTPSAVLVDAEGNVASQVEVGAPAVLSLLASAGRVHAQ